MRYLRDHEFVSGPAPELPRDVPGVFETVLLRAGTPLLWEEHWERFTRGCHHFGLEPPGSSADLRARVQTLAEGNHIATGVVQL